MAASRSRGCAPGGGVCCAQATDGGTGLNRTLWASRVRPGRAAVWTRQMAGLVASGLPLERALGALTDEADDERQRHLLGHLRAEVNAAPPSPAPCNSTHASSLTCTPP